MNELLAIVIIVIVCCAIFFAWLLSMATCPDKMINWLSGTTGNSTCSTSYNESKELIREDRDNDSVAVHSNAPNSVYLQLNNIARRSNSKKLSVVPEQDEQLTVTSISQVLFPASDRPSKYANNNQSEGAQRLAAHFEIHDDGPEAVVVVDGTSNMGIEPIEEEHPEPEYSGQGGLRYHYSLPAIHVA